MEMDKSTEQRCRLCFSTVNDKHFKDFKEIQDDTKNILDILFSKLNLDYSSKYIICDDCSRRVTEAFVFKSMCVNTNNTIILYVNDETVRSIDLKEIYMKEIGKRHFGPTEDYKVCLFCMQLVKDKFIPAHEMAVDMIDMYIPEIKLTMVEGPIVCKQCFDSFVRNSNFIKNCLEVNKRIKSFCGTDTAENSTGILSVDSYIKLEEVDIKSENEPETEWLQTDSTVMRFVHEGISNKINNIKTEDEISEASYITNSASANSLNQCNPSQENKYSATNCTSTLSPHLMSHKDTRNVCTFQSDNSDSNCEQKYSLQRAMPKQESTAEMEEFHCEICDYITKFENDLIEHHLTHEDISELQAFECLECDYKTKYKYYLKKHQLTHKDISETEIFECDICGYKTKRKNNFKGHQITHKDISEMKAFECDKCDFKAKYKNQFKKHQLKHQDISETRVFKCDMCDFKSKYKNSLKGHQVMHKDVSETEVFECEVCGYKTKRRNNLKQHQLIHTDISKIEAFQCDTCDFKTKHRNSIRQHQLTHRDVSEMEVFACGACNYKTTQKNSLGRHLLIHKDFSETRVFECDACDFVTKQKCNLKRHLLVHKDISETQQFRCSICDFKTKDKSSLKRHLLRHKDISKVEVC